MLHPRWCKISVSEKACLQQLFQSCSSAISQVPEQNAENKEHQQGDGPTQGQTECTGLRPIEEKKEKSNNETHEVEAIQFAPSLHGQLGPRSVATPKHSTNDVRRAD